MQNFPPFKISGIFLCSILLSILAFGQEVRKENLALKTDNPPKIDGLLNESAWKRAPDAGIYLQQELGREDAGRIKTVVKILFDDGHIYLGFLCYDPEPDKIQSETIRIDGDLRDTDSMYVLIDTFDDPDNYFYFSTNFLGIKSDGKISKDGQTANSKWNGKWESFGLKTDFGWSAEMAIERGCVFEEPVESKRLGLYMARVVPRMDGLFRSGPLDPPFDFSQLGPLQELELVGVEKGGSISPYVLSRAEYGAKVEPGAGVEAQYIFSPQLSGRLAVNPDFATVEPDEERVNLTPFELYLPEKRDFFQEEREDCQRPIDLFYSKRIGDIYGGVRIQGRTGAFTFSGMTTQAKKQEVLGEDSANFSVFSLERKSMSGSTSFGVMAANKFIDSRSIGTAGLYTDLAITDKLKLSGQFAYSYGDYSSGNVAFFIGPSYDSRNFHAHLHYIQLGEHFGDNVNRVAFIPDDNRRELDSAIHITFPFEEGFLSRIRYLSNYDIYWGMDGTLRSWKIDEGLYLDLRNNFVLSGIYTQEYMLNEYFPEPEVIFVPGEDGEPGRWIRKYIKDFRNDRVRIQSMYEASTWRRFGFAATVGHNFKSTFQMYELFKQLRITEQLFSEYDFCILNYDDERFFKSTRIHVLKITYYANQKLTWKLFFQVNSAIKKMNVHLMCTYNLLPLGTIQVVYQKGTAAFGIKGTQDHTLFLRLSHTF